MENVGIVRSVDIAGRIVLPIEIRKELDIMGEGSKVEILDGALNGFVGTITSIDDNTGKCRVIVEMFGRETPVDVSLEQVKEIN